MNNLQHLIFRGRNEEMLKIEKAIYQQSTSLVFIQASGGIGKTRLLQEVRKKFLNFTDTIILSSLIDLFDINISTPLSIEKAIIINLKISSDEFNNAYEAYTLIADGNNEILINEAINKVQVIFKKEIAKLTKTKKLVLLIDTLDEPQVKDSSLKFFISNILPELNNTTSILAGRESINELKSTFETIDYTPLYISLKPLKKEISYDILNDNINIAYKEKIYALSEGNPLLLGLSQLTFDYSERNLPSVFFEPIENLQKSSIHYKKNKELFEKQLIEPFAKLVIPYSEYILQMAYCQKRYNKTIMKGINNLSDSKADKILNDLKNFFFIKPFETTHFQHDELRDLINHYYWNNHDYPPTIRKDYYNILDNFYKTEIKLLQDNIDLLSNQKTSNEYKVNIEIQQIKNKITQFEIELFFYQLEEEPIKTANILSNKLEKALDDNKLIYASMLEKVIAPGIEKLNRTDEYFQLKSQLTWYYRTIGEHEKAEKFVTELIKNDINLARKTEYYQMYGYILKEQGKPLLSIEKFKEAIEITKETKDKKNEAYNYNNLAMAFVEIGLYEDAVTNFKKGINISQEEDFEKEEALFLGRLGNLYIYVGEHKTSQRLLEDAIEICEDIKEYPILNINRMYLATLFSYTGNFHRAYSLFEISNKYFDNNDDKRMQALNTLYLSNAQLHDYITEDGGQLIGTADFSEKLKWLKKSLKNATQSDIDCLIYAKDYYPESLLITGALHLQLALFYRNQNKFEDADANFKNAFIIFDKAYKLAKEQHNKRIQAKTLALFAEYFYEMEQSNELINLIAKFDKLNVENNVLHAFKGEIFYRIADNYFNLKNYDKAFENYNHSIPYLAEIGLWPVYYFSHYVKMILKKLFEVLKEDKSYKIWITKFKENWIDKPNNRIYPNELKTISEQLRKIERKVKKI